MGANGLDERTASYREQGLTSELTVPAALARSAKRFPDLPVIVDLCGSTVETWTYRRVFDATLRVASFLRSCDVGSGDVVMVQAPNSAAVVITCWASWCIGAICNPVVDIYRAHEMRQIVDFARPAAIVSVREHRGHSHTAMFDDLVAEADLTLRARIVLDEECDGWSLFERIVEGSTVPQSVDLPSVDAEALLLFTSGTTAAPKGVLHSGRAIVAEAQQLAHAWSFGWMDRIYLPLPIGHVTGVDFALTIPPVTSGCVVLSRMSSLAQAAAEVLEHGVTTLAAAPTIVPHLASIDAERARAQLKVYVSGGTTISPALLSAAEDLGLRPARIYGMTELPTVTAPAPSDSRRRRLDTDGVLAPGVECEAVDPATREAIPPGEEGELRVRGPELMLRYLDAEQTRAAIDDDRWFYTGDLGRVDDQRCVTVSGRIKDIINRGGEKFSAREIEDLLVSHPTIAAAAVVAQPDRRFGEVPAAFLVGEGDDVTVPTSAELAEFLLSCGIARQKIPVGWRWLDELPLTGSNKVKKHELLKQLDPTAGAQPPPSR
jgi:acyl-CoA synthetase